MSGGLLFTLLQVWQRNFDWISLTILGILIVGLGYILLNLSDRIKAVESIPSDGEIVYVR